MEKKLWRKLVNRDETYHLARIPFSRSRTSRLHSHDFAEIFWIESGRGQHEINGESKIVTAGDLVLVRPADQHVLHAVDAEGFFLVNLAFPLEVVAGLLTRHPELKKFYAFDAPLPVRCVLKETALHELQQEVNRLNHANRSRLFLERFLLSLFALLMPAKHAEHTLPAWLETACTEIQRPQNFAGGTRTFVRLAGRNAEYVARTTKSLLGHRPTDYINAIRMEYAARELRLGHKPIIEIALECGLDNLAYFYTLFRRRFHTTPRGYRLANQHPVV